MHVYTHVLTGWCAASCFELSPRERFLCMLAAGAADLDGVGIVAGWELYARYHHVLGHNLAASLLCTLLLACCSTRFGSRFMLYLLLFQLHIALDLAGSGAGWVIYYWWPLSLTAAQVSWAWELNSWQNVPPLLLLLLWTLQIAYAQGRTPLEHFFPRVDQRIVSRLRSWVNS